MLIDIQDVYKIYGEGTEAEVRALDGVSLTIDRGEFVAVVGQSGPDHDKTFEVEVTLNGKPLATGKGRSKKAAEQQAAKQALAQLNP